MGKLINRTAFGKLINRTAFLTYPTGQPFVLLQMAGPLHLPVLQQVAAVQQTWTSQNPRTENDDTSTDIDGVDTDKAGIFTIMAVAIGEEGFIELNLPKP